MYETTFLDTFPLWFVFVGSVIVIVIATEIGFFLGQRRVASLPKKESLHFGAAVGATMGLLAFILAFTFSMGTDRLGAKRALALDEANAIGTALLRTELLPEPFRTRTQGLLYDYIEQLLSVSELGESDRRFPKGQAYADRVLTELDRAKQIQDAIWQEAAAAARAEPTPVTALFISAVNEVIDMLQSRFTTSFQQRMLPTFWIILYCLAVMSIGLVGYDAGVSRSHRSWAQVVVALAFAAIMFLVVALDRPESSTIANLPLLELKAELDAKGSSG